MDSKENLYIKSYKKHFEHSYALGATLVHTLLDFRPEDAVVVYVHPSFAESESGEQLAEKCRAKGVQLHISQKLITRLSPKENVYVIGCFRKFATTLDANAPHVLLDDPSNSGNCGTIMRTMLGFGLRDLAIIRPGLDIFDPKTVRASMGAQFCMRFEYFDSFEQYRERFSARPLYPFMLDGSVPLNELTLPQEGSAYTLAFGNEARGLDAAYQTRGTPVRIPCSSEIDSYNLSIAAAIALYHFTCR